MKKFILMMLIISCLLLVTACKPSTIYFSEDFISDLDEGEEMENIEESYKVLQKFAKSMGINLQLPELDKLNPESLLYDITTGIDPFPSAILLEDGEPGRTPHTGKIFYFNGFASEDIGVGLSLIDVLVLEDFDNRWATILLKVPDDNEEWNNEEHLNNKHTFIFQYLGFSEEYNRYIGVLIKHEMLDW